VRKRENYSSPTKGESKLCLDNSGQLLTGLGCSHKLKAERKDTKISQFKAYKQMIEKSEIELESHSKKMPATRN
jgi:hypothetical protein